MLDIYPYPTLIKLKYYLDGVHHCVTTVGKWIFGSDFTFALPLTKDDLYSYCINDNIKKLNGYKEVSKRIRFFKNTILKVSFRNELHFIFEMVLGVVG